MGNPLDEVTGPVNEQGREVRVIEKQLPVEIGPGSTVFEIAVYVSGFAVAAVIQFLVKPPWEIWGYLILWVAAFLPAVIYALMKIRAKNYFIST